MFNLTTDLKPVLPVDISNGLSAEDAEFAAKFLVFCRDNGGIGLLAANQVGDTRNMVAFSDGIRWDVAVNPTILSKEGTSADCAIHLATQPKGDNVLVNVHQKIVVEFFSAFENGPAEYEATAFEVRKMTGVKTPSGKTSAQYVRYPGNPAIFHQGFQLAEKLLAATTLQVVKADYRTIKSSNGQKPNDPCSCNSGKKFKKCCGR